MNELHLEIQFQHYCNLRIPGLKSVCVQGIQCSSIGAIFQQILQILDIHGSKFNIALQMYYIFRVLLSILQYFSSVIAILFFIIVIVVIINYYYYYFKLRNKCSYW